MDNGGAAPVGGQREGEVRNMGARSNKDAQLNLNFR